MSENFLSPLLDGQSTKGRLYQQLTQKDADPVQLPVAEMKAADGARSTIGRLTAT